MTNTDHGHGADSVLDEMDHSIVTAAQPVQVLGAGKFLHAGWAGIDGDGVDAAGKANSISFRYGGELALRATREQEAVGHSEREPLLDLRPGYSLVGLGQGLASRFHIVAILESLE